jgi:hypothetical protein
MKGRYPQHDREAVCCVFARMHKPAIALVLTLLSSAQSLAQGCAACYTTAASGGPQTAHALRSGILFLLFPPVLILGGIVVIVRNWELRKRLDR